MTNAFQDIFGGSTSTSTPTNMNPLTSALQTPVTNAFTSAIGQGTPQYTGPTTVGTTATENTMMANIAGMVNPSNPTNTLINGAANGSFLPGGSNFNPFVSSAISAADAPIEQQYGITMGQNTPAQFTAGGQQVQGSRLNASGQAPGSTAFTNAEAINSVGEANALATTNSSIENNAYNTGVGATTSFAALQPQEVNAAINGLQANLLPTLLQEQGITNGLQAFQENVTALTSFLSTIASAMTPVVGNTTTSSSTNGILPDIASLATATTPKTVINTAKS